MKSIHPTNHAPEEVSLSNGIPVILQHFDGPVGTFHWWNLTGSTDENPDEAGFAHFLEHMLFKDAGAKDTGQASTGKTARAIEGMGGEINAYTTFDQTVYHVTSSEQYWEQVIDQFGIMAKPQKFLKDDFEREREVILEELRRGQDSPDRQLYEKLFKLTYKKHPYGRPVIGFEKILKAATVQKLEKFYQRQYVSSQMGLVLVGPMHDEKGARKKRLLSILEKRFGKGTIPKRVTQRKPRPLEPVLSPETRVQSAFFDVKTPELAWAFRIPDIAHHDIPEIEVLSGVLGMGESSRLYQRLFNQESIVTDVSTSVYVPRDPGMFLVSAELKQTSDHDKVVAILCEEIKKIQQAGPTEEEIKRVVTNLESEKMYSTQTVDGVAARLGYLRYSLGDLNFDHSYLERLKHASVRSIKHLANVYLTPERMNAVLLQPKGETAASFEKVKKSFSTLHGNVMTVKPEKKKTASTLLVPTIFTTSSGLKVAHLQRAGNPVFSLYFSAFGGTRSELTLDPTLWGSSHLMADTWTKGIPGMSALDIAKVIEGSASSLGGFSGRNTIGLQMSGLIRDWTKLTELFQQVLVQPTFQEVEFLHSKRVTEESIRSIPNHSSQVCSKLFMETLFEKHPYGKQPLGTLEQLQTLRPDHLKRIHQEWVHPANSALTIVGGVSTQEILDFVESLDRAMCDFSGSRKKPQIESLSSEPTLLAPRWANADFKREQTHIMVGGLGITLHDRRRYALRLLQNILGGQSGRLFIELREKKSMAYSVSPVAMEGLETGYFGTYIACAPSKKDEAIAGMIQVVETLAKSGPTAHEMKRAKNYYLGQRAMDLQSSWSLAGSFGLELLYRQEVIAESEIRKAVEKVTAREIQNVARDLFVNANKVTVVVG